MKRRKKVIYLSLALLIPIVGELLISFLAFGLFLIGLGLFGYLFPIYTEFYIDRKQKNREKEITRLEKRLSDLRTEVV